jgi:hypothetical protein
MFQSYTTPDYIYVGATDQYTYVITIVDDDFTETVQSTPAKVLLDGWTAQPAAAVAVVEVYARRKLSVGKNLFLLWQFIDSRRAGGSSMQRIYEQYEWCMEHLPECKPYADELKKYLERMNNIELFL